MQNPWGPAWGQNDFALRLHKDWQVSITDAWALTLALPTPQIFPWTASTNYNLAGEGLYLFVSKPKRAEIA